MDYYRDERVSLSVYLSEHIFQEPVCVSVCWKTLNIKSFKTIRDRMLVDTFQ